MLCSVVFLLSLNKDITCALVPQELALQELVPQVQALVPQALVLVPVLVLVPEPLLLSLQAQPVSFLVQMGSLPIQKKKLLTSAPKE